MESDISTSGLGQKKEGGDWMKNGEGIGQRTCMHDPWS